MTTDLHRLDQAQLEQRLERSFLLASAEAEAVRRAIFQENNRRRIAAAAAVQTACRASTHP